VATVTQPRATIDDLYRVDGKAELIGGRIVRFMPTGEIPSVVASEIFVSLRAYAKQSGRGRAYNDGLGFTVPVLKSGRESFCPDAAFHAGPFPANGMRFVPAAPTFAVEVRSENDYGPAAEREMAAKRSDYFEAGTLVVWDVDPVAGLIHVYRSDQSVTYARGDTADAEPAVPGWRVAVDELMG
jgi:Uma2 family endonuclease